MPSMPRPKTKPTKIAFKVLGVPVNLQYKRTKDQRKINQRLIFEETVRVR